VPAPGGDNNCFALPHIDHMIRKTVERIQDVAQVGRTLKHILRRNDNLRPIRARPKTAMTPMGLHTARREGYIGVCGAGGSVRCEGRRLEHEAGVMADTNMPMQTRVIKNPENSLPKCMRVLHTSWALQDD
jgi:hypothetical protein